MPPLFFFSFIPNCMFFSTFIDGKRVKSWKTMPMPLSWIFSPVISFPSSVIVPPSGLSRPAIKESSVDLPEPDGPIMHRNSPSSTPKDADSVKSLYFFSSFLTSRYGILLSSFTDGENNQGFQQKKRPKRSCTLIII